jgi:hypothetical protein
MPFLLKFRETSDVVGLIWLKGERNEDVRNAFRVKSFQFEGADRPDPSANIIFSF